MRRAPKQLRAQHTIIAILDAATLLLQRGGLQVVTTNHIADLAGVSIGSVYQYFPDKLAIYQALHDRHVERIAGVVEKTLVVHADATPAALVKALIEALVDAHVEDAAIGDALATVPGGTRALSDRLRNAFRLALAPHHGPAVLERALFVIPTMVEAFAHAVGHRGSRLSLAAAKQESVRAVLAYLETI
ncbi:MAG: TetR family transcriptional regulator [Kofleriaceae bacterium]